MARMETPTIRPIGLVILVILLLFAPFFVGHFPAVGDMRNVYIPLELFFQDELRQGNVPSWNPDAAFGYPVIASAQIGFFYPPLFIARLIFPIQLYLPLIVIAHFAFLAYGTYKFANKLTTNEGALLAAISFTLGSFVLQHLTHLNIIITLSWLPWQLLAMRHVAQVRPIKFQHIALLALVTGLPFLAGQLQIPLLIACISSFYFLWLGFHKKDEFKKKLRSLVVVVLLAIALAAAQLLPTAELAQNSSRGGAGDFNVQQANQYSWPLYHAPTVFFPRFFDTDDQYWGKRLEIEYGFYIGILPLLLSLWLLLPQKQKIRKRLGAEGMFFVWLAGISFLLALGSLSPFRLIGFEPSLWVFSAPARWLLFTTFSLSLLSSIALPVVLKTPRPFIKYIRIITVLIIAGIAIANFFLFAIPEANLLQRFDSPTTQTKIASLLNSARSSSVSLKSFWTYLPVVTLLVTPILLRTNKAKHSLVAVTGLELLILGMFLTPTTPWSQILATPETLSQLPDSVKTGQARTYSIRDGGDTGAYFTDPESRANTITRYQFSQLLVPLQSMQHHIPGVEWPASLHLAGHEPALAGLRGDEGGYEIQDQDKADQLNIGAVLSFEGNAPSITTRNPEPRASAPNALVQYRAISSTHTQLSILADSDTTVTIRDSFYPGWQAQLNGQPVPISPTKNIFRGIDVPAGKHIINLTYQPQPLIYGMGVSLLAAAILALGLVRTRFSK